MPRKERSTESKIKEHKKYRKQCEVRIATSKKLILFIIFVAAILTWFIFEFWKIGVGIVLLSIGSLIIEMWAYRKHDKAIYELSK